MSLFWVFFNLFWVFWVSLVFESLLCLSESFLSLFCPFWGLYCFFSPLGIFAVQIFCTHSKILSLSQSKWKLCNASPPFHFVYFPFALISNYIEPHQHTTQPSCNPLAASNYNKRKGKYILLCSLSHCAQLFSFFFSVSTQMLSFYMLAEP